MMVINGQLALYCNQTNFNHLLIKFNQSNSINCDVGIFPTQFFYPYTWYEFKILFEKNATVSIKKFFNTYSVHFYGKMSESKKMNKNDNSLFEYFASLNCPIMYSKHIL
jgi:hypothetical protein